MSIYESIKKKEKEIAVVGLGYVGLPIAVEFAKKVKVIGFDIADKKVELMKSGIDPTKEVGDEAIKNTTISFTSDPKRLKDASFIIVAVPTPVGDDKLPDLTPVESATELIGKNLSKDTIIVYESTVYPGVTEDICIPILEKESGLKCGIDFKVGYSPERINPGDKVHRLTNIKKIVSGMDKESLEEIANVYELVIEAGVHRVSSIKVAEAAKVAENSQRDINIAFVNELSMIFDKMGIDTNEVVDAMNTKWNALGFRPGLVGGHCIAVDPYYLIYEADKLGYESQIISAGRRVNDGMSSFISNRIINKLESCGKKLDESKVAVLGITFKEDCPDMRNSLVVEIVNNLKEKNIDVLVTDPHAKKDDVKEEYNIELINFDDIKDVDCIVLAVAHKDYKELNINNLDKLFNKAENNNKILIDIKGILNKEEIKDLDYNYWSL